ncbi:hypothetical protein QJQ45_014068 [Haematococcus lacustris]|nr:hypothetical protein QJQ45_014068 [Haematococcus lacustris]
MGGLRSRGGSESDPMSIHRGQESFTAEAMEAFLKKTGNLYRVSLDEDREPVLEVPYTPEDYTTMAGLMVNLGTSLITWRNLFDTTGLAFVTWRTETGGIVIEVYLYPLSTSQQGPGEEQAAEPLLDAMSQGAASAQPVSPQSGADRALAPPAALRKQKDAAGPSKEAAQPQPPSSAAAAAGRKPGPAAAVHVGGTKRGSAQAVRQPAGDSGDGMVETQPVRKRVAGSRRAAGSPAGPHAHGAVGSSGVSKGLSVEEESNLCVFLNAHVKQTEWEVIDGTCPLQKDDWSDELRLLIHMEYLWRRSISVLHAVDVNRLINTVLHLDERQNREVAYGQAAWHAVSQLQKAVGDAMLELHQRQRAAFQQQQQELERQLRQQNDTVLMLQQQLQASEKARAQMQKQMLQQEQQVKKQMEQLTASVASLLEEAGKPAAPATTTSKGQKRGRSGKQVDNSEEATVWRPCNYADGNVVVKKFTPEQADQWREAVLEMGVAMTSLPGHLIPTSQLEWALQLLSLVFGYAIFNDIPLTESHGWPVISEGELDVRYSTGQRLQMPFTTANADGSLPDDVSMSGCWTARSLRIIRKDQAMAAQQDAAGEAARTRLKQYATAVRLARPYLRKLQQHASQLSQVTLRGGTVLTNDTMHGRDVNSVGMALTKATGLVAAQALHVDVNPDPSLSTPPHTAAAAAAATAPQTSSPPSHAVPSTSAPAASSATTPTAPPRFIWGRDGLVMIIAVGVTQVMVSPGSHVQVLKVEKKHKGEISARVLKTAMKAMPKMQVYRVTLQPGEVLGMRGYTVHAGDWGLPDKASTRVHLYGSEGYINNATCFLSMLDVEFVHKCQPTSPPQRREQYDNWPPGLGPLHGGLYVQPEPYERPARAPVDTLWNSDWALSDELVQAELTSLLGHWDESMAAEAAEEAEKEKKKGKKVVVAEVTEEAQETEEAGGKEAGDEEARKKKQGRKSMPTSKYHPYKGKGGHAARCALCVKTTPAGLAGWVEIHVEGEAASYRSGQSVRAIGQVTTQMAETIKACDNLVPALIPLAHRTCAESAAAALAVGKRLQGQEQPMPSLCSTPTQAAAQPGPAHAPCPHHLPDHHPSQSQLQGLLHLPGLSILTRPATNPLTSPAEEQQPIIILVVASLVILLCVMSCRHTTVEQDEQTMPPSMPKQQQDWATTRAIAAEVLQQIQQVPALLRLLRLQPDSKVTLQLSTLQDAEAQLGRLEFALQHIMQPRPFSSSLLAPLPEEQGPSTPAPLQQGVNTPADSMPSASMQPLFQPGSPSPSHSPPPASMQPLFQPRSPSPSHSPPPASMQPLFQPSSPSPSHSPSGLDRLPLPLCPRPDPCPWHDQNLASGCTCLCIIHPGSMGMHSCFFPAAGIQVEWSQTACACAQCMTPAPRGVCMRPFFTKPFVAMPMFDQKRDDKHWDDECLTLLCSFAPDSVMQLCTSGKKLSVKMLNEYCKAVGLYVPANTLRADLRYIVLEHLNEQAECD